MTHQLNDSERRVFAVLADVLIPEAEGMPSASQVGIQNAPLDRVLKLEPSFASDLRRGVRAAVGHDPTSVVESLHRDDPAALNAIGLVASAAYYMQPRVRELLGYPGQVARPATADEEHDYLREGLLQAVIDRGPIYRPVPK